MRPWVALEVLAKRFLMDGILHGRYDAKWQGSEAFIPAGGAQLAILWHKIGTPWAVEARDKMNTLLSVVATSGARASMDVAGALPGSFPMWGGMRVLDCRIGPPNTWWILYLMNGTQSMSAKDILRSLVPQPLLQWNRNRKKGQGSQGLEARKAAEMCGPKKFW